MIPSRGKSFLWPPIFLVIFIIFPGFTYGGTPNRIITLAPNVTETVYALGQGDKIVAVSHQCDYPTGVKKKKRVGDMINPSLEMIVTLKPDLVIMTDDGNPKSVWEKLQGLNIPTYVYGPRRLKDLGPEIRKMGFALGVGQEGRKLARQVESDISKYRLEAGKSRGRRAIFVLQTRPVIVAGRGTAIDDVMNLLGLHNIALPYGLNYPTISREQIVSFNPEVIFVGHDAVKAEVLKWEEIEAVRLGRIYTVGPAVYRMSPRLREGIREMADFLSARP